MISLLMCSRAKGNKNHGLKRFLESLYAQSHSWDNFEVLIKIDEDDDEFDFNVLKNWPFQIKHIVSGRGRGYEDLHIGYKQIFNMIDKRSVMVGCVADDFTVLTPYWDVVLLRKVNEIKGNIFIIHSHPVNLDFSFKDMSNVLVDDAPFWSVHLMNTVDTDWIIYGTDAWTSALEKILKQNGVSISLFTGTTLFQRHSDQSIDGPEGPRWTNERKRMFEYIATDEFKQRITLQATQVMKGEYVFK